MFDFSFPPSQEKSDMKERITKLEEQVVEKEKLIESLNKKFDELKEEHKKEKDVLIKAIDVLREQQKKEIEDLRI